MWWCNNCKREMAGYNVTYEENCAICGTPITSLDVEYSDDELLDIIKIGEAIIVAKENHISIPTQYMNDFITEETIEYLLKLDKI